MFNFYLPRPCVVAFTFCLFSVLLDLIHYSFSLHHLENIAPAMSVRKADGEHLVQHPNSPYIPLVQDVKEKMKQGIYQCNFNGFIYGINFP